MQDFLSFLDSMKSGSFMVSPADQAANLSSSSLLLIIFLCMAGARWLSVVTNRETLLETAVSFSALLVGALMANEWMKDLALPVETAFIKLIITSSTGMTVAALLLLAAYRRTDARA